MQFAYEIPEGIGTKKKRREKRGKED